ncbi:Phosphatidylinositol N-acetylglucosaminyltransferase subunit H [Liparis tanakae]|uniref:Phosphatidylinositol N-acetylglucosaminyltransferase subunit H n=1 Tax=Liparis tanakae TaxID=230148 RepID=A0A4Z2ETI0_9TELE|nr:Phosphatidylinositol N-acetylglucosaminyltransferase subunit H [Liparis tanakae]
MFHIHFVKVDHESLMVIRSLGIQLSSSYASGRETTTFIEMSKIKDIVINEAIYMQQIIYFLCVLLKDPSEPNAVSSVVPLFQSSKPKLKCLVKVYKSCQEIMPFFHPPSSILRDHLRVPVRAVRELSAQNKQPGVTFTGRSETLL